MLDTRQEKTGRISIVGHRGAPECAPENTMASFQEGLRQGADVIELDVQLSADGHVVVFHDDCLERTTNGRGLLAERSLAELKALDAGAWFDPRFAGEPIPTLDQVLEWARDSVPLFVELKFSAAPEPTLGAAVVERIQAHEMTEQVVIISFAHQALSWVKQGAPNLATAALYAAPVADPVALARGIGANAVMPLWHLVTADGVASCHAAKLSVNVWGSGADYGALIAKGVDCVNADYPAQVRLDFF
jgi:glycerophosphoryl diester phosphodiesterase